MEEEAIMCSDSKYAIGCASSCTRPAYTRGGRRSRPCADDGGKRERPCADGGHCEGSQPHEGNPEKTEKPTVRGKKRTTMTPTCTPILFACWSCLCLDVLWVIIVATRGNDYWTSCVGTHKTESIVYSLSPSTYVRIEAHLAWARVSRSGCPCGAGLPGELISGASRSIAALAVLIMCGIAIVLSFED